MEEEFKKLKTIRGESQEARNRRLGLTNAKERMSAPERHAHNVAASNWFTGESRRIKAAPTLDEIERRLR